MTWCDDGDWDFSEPAGSQIHSQTAGFSSPLSLPHSPVRVPLLVNRRYHYGDGSLLCLRANSGVAMPEASVFISCSLDGFIAGVNNELDWLPGPDDGVEDTFTPFMSQVGAMLMGRNTYDTIAAMEGSPWPYGDTPVFVATSRPLDTGTQSVRYVWNSVIIVVFTHE